MTTRIRKVITAIDSNGNAFSEQHTETQVGEKWFPNDPTPLDNTSAWGAQFSATLEAENTTLKTAKSAIEADLATRTSERDAIQSQFDALTAEKATLTTEKAALIAEKEQLIADNQTALDTLSSEHQSAIAILSTQHQAAIDAKQVELNTANATIARLEADVAELSPFRPFNKRHLASTDVLLARLTQKETKAFYSSNDPIILGGQALFDEYEAEGYYVDLDDTDVQNLTAYMVQLGMLESMERREVILRHATAQEAYYPPRAGT